MKKQVLVLAISLLGITLMQAQTGNVTNVPLNVMIGYTEFQSAYVTPKFEKWRTQDKMRESTQEYVERLRTQSDDKIMEYRIEAKTAYLNYVKEYYKAKGVFESFNLSAEDYNADGDRFTIEVEDFGEIAFTVPHGEEAAHFLEKWKQTSKIPIYNIDNNGNIVLEKLEFKTPMGKSYVYDSKITLPSLPPIDPNLIAMISKSNRDAEQTLADEIKGKPVIVESVNVDTDIPVTNVVNDKTFVVIIANEIYQQVSTVEFARNDGKIFREYCEKTLGIPKNRILLVENATFGNITHAIDQINRFAQSYKEEATIIFYYAGHGIPDENTETAYLLPVDGYPSNITTAYKLDNLYQTLGNLPVKSVIVFMDACFSGAKRDGTMMASARGVEIKTKQGDLSGNTVVFAAAASGQTAFPYREQKHGLFTYFLLRKLKESKGDITLGELSQYVISKVDQRTIDLRINIQTPNVQSSPALKDKWSELKLK
jgi:hypothetical protein